jgi:phage I-like protein
MTAMLDCRPSSAVALCAAVAADELRAALCFALSDTATGDGEKWVELIPAPNAQGKVQGRDGRWWRMADPKAVATRFDLALSVDVNHASELQAPKGGEAPAYGWIEALEVREGAIWGRIEWNEAGRNAVAERKYRFLSPVFTFDDKSRQIQKVTSVALVNDPNFPLALNRAGNPDPTVENTVDEAIRKALGLSEQATPDQAVTAINSLRTSAANPSMEHFVPKAQYDVALNRASAAEQKLREQEQVQQQAAIDAAVDGAVKAGKITPPTVDYYKAQCATEGGLERFQKFVEAQPVIAAATDLGERKTPGADGGKALNAATKSVAALMGVSEEDIAKFGGDQ